MLSCATLAMATATLAPQKARAQAFQGTISSSTNATQDITGPNSETITITAPTAVINWTPTDGATGTAAHIDFLPNGHSATFTSNSGVLDYTVLNRILPLDTGRAIELNGNVLATLEGTSTTGGNVWFYSPGGIVIGASAVFDVGGLLLSTADITDWSTNANGFTASFSAPSDSPSAIQVLSGAQINALQQNSYVALVAPRLDQAGSVRVDGSVAYVAAEQLTMTMNQGLFDIQVDVGTSDDLGIVHAGSTGGTASTGAGDNHGIYMVAVPKNQALATFLTGNVGFDSAASAEIKNGVIILSAGYNVATTQGETGEDVFSGIAPRGEGTGSFHVDTGTYSSDVLGHADLNFYSSGLSGDTTYLGDVMLIGDAAAHINARNGNDISIAGDATVISHGTESFGTAFLNADIGSVLAIGGDAVADATSVGVGGNATVSAGGLMTIGGDLSVHADSAGNVGTAAIFTDGGSIDVSGGILLTAYGFAPPFSEVPGSAFGGNANVIASNGGTVTAASLEAHADAWGDSDYFSAGFSGNGIGGYVNITTDSGGGIAINGDLFATADGYGGALLDGTTSGGYGQGGSIRIAADGGSVTIDGNAALSANGSGGNYEGEGIPSSAVSGDGYGGWARFETTTDAGSAITVGGGVVVNANGFGGFGQTGGAGYGGSAGIQSFTGSIGVTGAITLNTNGIGGDAVIGEGGAGGNAQGGTSYIQAEGTSSITGGNTFLDSNALGGDGGAGNGDNILAGSGGDAQGGVYTGEIGSGGAFALADAAGAILQLGNLTMSATGTGGMGGMGGAGQVGGTGGDAYGGFVQAGSFNPSQATEMTGVAEFGDVSMNASGYAGDGGAGDEGNGGAANGDGGDAFGGGNTPCGETGETCGGAVINAKGSVIINGDVWMGAHAGGGDGATGGNATGGSVWVQTYENSTLDVAGDLDPSAAAWGGYGSAGNGGTGTGGQAVAIALGGSTFAVDGQLFLDSGASGGSVGTTLGAAGGSGTGGESYLGVAVGGSLTAGDIYLWSAGTGGAGSTQGGDGTGGTATIDAEGMITADIIRVQAFGYGGQASTGAGGNATGGEAVVNAVLGGTLTYGSELVIDAPAWAGNGLTEGGTAIGGTAELMVDAASVTGTGTIIVASAANGGFATDEGNGGDATGGSNLITILNGGDVTAAGFLNLNAAAYGGVGAWQGGNAEAGSSTIVLAGGDLTAGSIGNYANAWGGDGYLAGYGIGGDASLTINELGGSIDVAGMAGIEAIGFGGDGVGSVEGLGADGGVATGGTASVDISAGGSADFGSVYAEASAVGGAGGAGDTGGAGGNGTAGWATVNVDGVLVATGEVTAFSEGRGGVGGVGITTGGQGGAGYGGDASVTISGNADVGGVTSWSRGYGGHGGSGATHGDGGFAEGGSSNLQITGDVVTGGILVNATAFGGNGANGGNGVGGESVAFLIGALDSEFGLQVTAQGFGGAGNSGAGGDGTGGTSDLYVEGATATGWAFLGNGGFGGAGVTAGGAGIGGSSYASIGSSMSVDTTFDIQAWATGGNASQGNGGNATGGTAQLGGTELGFLTAGEVALTAEATGGNGGTSTAGGAGGNATGGTALVGNWEDNLTGQMDISGTLSVSADATGGHGGNGTTGVGGDGGNATAGPIAFVNIDSGATVGSIVASAQATGGNGGTGSTAGIGGDAFGGHASVDIFNDSTLNSTGTVDILSAAVGGDGSNGGSAYGGTSGFGIYGASTADINTVNMIATGMGGTGSSGYGGAGEGGLATMLIYGSVTTDGLLRIDASGTGGNGVDGGTGLGGGVEAGAHLMITAGGSLNSLGGIDLLADGFGGTGSSGLGGTGWAGEAILTDQGSWTSSGAITVSANGEGGDGGSGGGDGEGGSAAVRIGGGTANLTGSLTVRAAGTGGNSVNGTGGNGYGNYARMSAYDGGTITANNVTVDSSGTGGAGVNGGDGYAGQNFEGWGGSVIQSFDAGSSMTLTGNTVVRSNGVGGAATSSTGGDGVGGFSSVGGIGAPMAFDSVLIQANGVRGLGGGGNGTGTGGLARIVAEDGGSATGAAVGIQALGSTEGGTVEVLAWTGGDISLDSLFATADSGLAAGDVLVSIDNGSSAYLGVANLWASGGPGGNVTIDIGSGGTSPAGDLLFADGLTINVNGTANLLSQNGAGINVAQSVNVGAAGLVTLDDATGGDAVLTATDITLDGSNVLFDWGFDAVTLGIVVDGDYALGALTYGADTLSITAGGAITALESVYYGANLVLNAGTSLTVADMIIDGGLGLTATQNIQAGDLIAGGGVTMTAGGSILAGDVSAGLAVVADAGTTLTLGNVTSGYTPPSQFSTTALAVAAEDVALSSGGDMFVESVNSAGAIMLNAGGKMTTGSLDAETSIAATSAQTMQIQSASAGQDVTLTSGADFAVGDVSAGGNATFTAATLAAFYGTVGAPTITVTSGGLLIDDEAGLGVHGLTSLLTFNAVSNSPIVIGGDGSASGYQISGDGDISANSVVVNAVAASSGGSAPDVILRDLEIEGSATSGGGVGSVALNTGGSIIVEGDVAFIDAGANDTLSLNAGDVIEVITNTGSITMTGSNGQLAGMLNLTAHDIWVADQSVIAQLEANPNFAGLADALATNNGPVNPNGYVQAGGVTATMLGSSFLVQNSGTAEQPGGLTVGPGGLTIINQGSDPATVIIYGQQINADGSVIGGDAFVENVTIGGTGGFSGDSSINGCDVSGNCGLDGDPQIPGTGAESILGPIGLMGSPSDEGSNEDDEEEEENEDESGNDPSTNLINTAPLQIDTTIDEPITSGSDSPGGMM